MTVAVVVALCTFIHRKPALLGVEPGSSQQMYWMAGVIAAGVVFLIIMGVYHLLNRHAAVQNFELRRQLAAGDDYRAVTTKKADSRHPAMVELAAFLRDRYGPFWRRKIRLLLVTGEPEQAEAIAPGLTGQHWLEGDHTVLIYGGRPSAEPDVALLTALKKLRRSRPLDGIIWPLTEEQSRQTAQLDKGWRELINGGKRLGFQAPFYLWQVCDNGDYQSGRVLQSVGCLLPEGCTPEQLAAMLEAQTLPLTEQGMSQLLTDNRHDFLLRLAHTLAERGITHWQTVLKPLLAGGAFSSLRLRGLMFSPPLAAVPEAAPHAWLPSPV
ncbi:TPA: ImcF-related family protein, partial [Escherichia coli]|nr:type VI secretion protein VasK [Escherichia coli O25b:H4-ST131]